MPMHTNKILLLLAATAISVSLAIAETPRTVEQRTLVIDSFQSGISDQWQEKRFKGQTHYKAAQKDNLSSIMAESNGAASGLFFKITYKPETYPIIEWSWQIEHVLAAGNARLKEGDDYAARIYVVFPSLFFWRTKAINYVWANKLDKGELLPNAYTPNAAMIAVESGNQHAGQWLTERRNIIEDYQRAFGEPPPEVGAIAIMTDTDDTGEQARAWYGPITIKSEPGSAATKP